MSGLSGMKKAVEQLRREANLDRVKVSKAGADLVQYCEQHASEDMLLTGISPTGENPFKDKSKCVIL